MKVLRAALQLPLALPAYWRECRAAVSEMDCTLSHFTYGPHRRQYVLLAEPPTSRLQPGRYAFYFHGGGWTFGRPDDFLPAATPWLNQGYRVILPSYRRPPLIGLNRIVEDCYAAIQHLAPEEPINDLQIGGISAGAHLAALLAMNGSWWRNSGWNKAPSAVLACAGPMSFTDLQPRRLFLPRYQHLDPVQNVPSSGAEAARWLLLHGTGDATVDILHSRKFLDELQKKGYQSELIALPEGTHLDAGRWMFGGPLADRVGNFIAGNPPA